MCSKVWFGVNFSVAWFGAWGGVIWLEVMSSVR